MSSEGTEDQKRLLKAEMWATSQMDPVVAVLVGSEADKSASDDDSPVIDRESVKKWLELRMKKYRELGGDGSALAGEEAFLWKSRSRLVH